MTSTAVEFDFQTKRSQTIALDAASAACLRGLSCWLDFDTSKTDRAQVESVLKELGVNALAIEQALGPDQEGRYDVYDDCLHVACTASRTVDAGLETRHVDILVSEKYVITLHRGGVDFIEQIRKTYRQDFEKFAKTLSFIIYELFDHLIEGYRRTSRGLEAHVERFQARIFAADDDTGVFAEAGRITRDLLTSRAIVLATRDVLHEVATRRSAFVAESCQPFLANLVGTLERLAQDLAVEREVMAELLTISMGITGAKTNRIVNRLTAMSTIFLPLTFLCGVYGMNFDTLPELRWKYSYPVFWLACLVISLGLLTFMRRKRWV